MGEIVGCCSMYANPLGPHHLEYLRLSKEKCDKLVVILNNDKQAILKHGRTFMTLTERIEILRSIKYVDLVIASIDTDRAVCLTLRAVRPHKFFNGGDQKSENIPEADVCNELNIQLVDGMGTKTNSSRWILKNYLDSFNG
jgi:cytidyltransferase-like protein